MGSHTWIYKKVSALTDEEKENFLTNYRENYNSWWGFKSTKEELMQNVSNWGKEYLEGKTVKQYVENMIEKYSFKRDEANNSTFDHIVTKYGENLSHIRRWNGELYMFIKFDFPFRVFGYPEDTFTNVDELVNWLKVTDNTIGYYDEDGKFVEGFSEELENRIKEFFKECGENDLMVYFG